MSPEEFAGKLSQYSDGKLFMSNGNLIKFERKKRQNTFSPILMTAAVFEGFKKANLTRGDILKNYWYEQKHQIKNVDCNIYGADVHWII